jgi:hypothetical protein
MKYGTTEMKVPAVGKPHTEFSAATPSPTTFREIMQALDIVHRKSQVPQVTSRLGSSQMWSGSEKPKAANDILPPMPDGVPDLR